MSRGLAQESRRIENHYPGFMFRPRARRLDVIARNATPSSVVETMECDNPVKAWRGTIQPFASDPSAKEVAWIIADLVANRDVDVRLNGTLGHLPSCAGSHDLPPDLIPGRRLTEAYTIEMTCRIPPGLPVVRAIAPLICPEASVLDAEGHPMIQEPFRPPHLQWREQALCITFPPDRGWEWGEGVLLYVLDQSAIWLAKHTVWSESRERLGSGNGIWIGSATTHDEFAFVDRLAELDAQDPCHCSRPASYDACCRPKEAVSAFAYAMTFVCDPSRAEVRSALGRFKPQYRQHVLSALDAGPLAGTCCWITAARLANVRHS